MSHHLLFLLSNFIVLQLVSGTLPTGISTHLPSQFRTDNANPSDTIHTNQLVDRISVFVHEHWGWLAALFLKPHQKSVCWVLKFVGVLRYLFFFFFFFFHNATLWEQILFSVSWLSLRVGSQVMLVIVVMSHSCCSAGTYRTRTLRQMQSLFSCQHYSRYLFRIPSVIHLYSWVLMYRVNAFVM